MRSIYINNRQKDNLCNEIAKLVLEFKKNKEVICMYFAPYFCAPIDNDNFLRLTIIVGNRKVLQKLSRKVINYNMSYLSDEQVSNLGFRILIETDLETEYSIAPKKASEIKRSRRLYNSSILFDKNGKHRKIKNEAQEKGYTEEFDNSAHLVPSIKDDINISIDDKILKLQ